MEIEIVDQHWYPTPELVSMEGRQVRRVWEYTRKEKASGTSLVFARVEVIDGVPGLRRIEIAVPDGWDPIGTAAIRGFDVEGLIEYMGGAARGAAYMWTDDGKQDGAVTVEGVLAQERPGRLAVRKARHAKINDAFLREVSEVHRKANGDAPVRAVAEHFGKSRKQAGNYILAARKRGFIPADLDGGEVPNG